MMRGLCVECAAPVDVPQDVMLHEFLVCPECGTGLEVVEVDPVQLDRAPVVEEDWGE